MQIYYIAVLDEYNYLCYNSNSWKRLAVNKQIIDIK